VISIEGFHVVVDGTEPDECDPYMELGFTCEEECLEAEVAGSLDATVRSNSCGLGGGGGGGDGPGGGGGGGVVVRVTGPMIRRHVCIAWR
jgi:hypothetical protein